MAKRIAMILALVLLLSACSAAPARSEIRTFQEFEEKWKFEDFESVLKNPAAFLEDFSQLRRKDDNDRFLVEFDFSNWTDETLQATMNAASASHIYNKTCTLFWQPFDIQVFEPPVSEGTLRTVILRCESDDFEGIYCFAKSVALYLLDEAGDEVTVEMDDAKTDAASLRKFLKNDKDLSAYIERLDKEFSFNASSSNIGIISFALHKRAISGAVHAYCSLFWH